MTVNDIGSTTTTTTTVESPSLIQKALKVLAYPIAAASGLFFGHKYARNAIYDYYDKQGDFDKLKKALINDKYESSRNAAKPLSKKALKEFEHVEEPALRHVQGMLGPHNAKYNEEITKILRSKGYKNSLHYFQDLAPIQKSEALVAFLGPASIAFGVALTVADSQALGKLTHFTQKKHTDAPAQR